MGARFHELTVDELVEELRSFQELGRELIKLGAVKPFNKEHYGETRGRLFDKVFNLARKGDVV